MRNRGFTLIELMIVVAIIAVIAAIAVPNFIRSRISANEAAAIAACKAYASAQNVYLRTDYDADGVLEYATALRGSNTSLFESAANSADLTLIAQDFAFAECNAGAATDTCQVPRQGYSYAVLTGTAVGTYFDANGNNMISGFGLSAKPVQYDTSGRNSLQINQDGRVYQRDEGNAVASTHSASYMNISNWVLAD